jgi:hypothetical protein
MAQQFLHGADVMARLQQVRGKRMTQHVWRDRLGDARHARRLAYHALRRLGVDVVAPLHMPARARIRARVD